MSSSSDSDIIDIITEPSSSSAPRKRKHISKKTAKERAAMRGNEAFYADGLTLFCRVCNKGMDHSRQSVLDRHCKSKMHMENASKLVALKQKTLTTTLFTPNAARLENAKLVTEFVRMLVAAKIPFNIVREFLRVNVKAGGAIPGRKALLPYLTDCYKTDKEKLKNKVAGKKVVIYFDETSDACGRFVCAILFSIYPAELIGQRPLLADVSFERTPLNQGRVSQIILSAMTEYSITYENVIGIATDNASYMVSAFKNILKSVLPNSLHLCCLAHLLNLVVSVFIRPFEKATAWSQAFSHYFSNSGARKFRYLEYLESIGESKKLPPQPVTTRWLSMFTAIQYHKKLVGAEKTFVELEILDHPDNDSLDRLSHLLHDYKHLVFELNFVSARALPYIRALRLFESDSTIGVMLFSAIEDIVCDLAAQKEMPRESVADILEQQVETFLSSEKNELIAKVNKAVTGAEDKLMKYFSEANGIHPAREFIKQLQYFHPKRSLMFDLSPALHAIPGFTSVPEAEKIRYRSLAREFSFEEESTIEEEVQAVMDFWKGAEIDLPNLSALGRTYGAVTCSSAAVERVFSYYNKLLSDERQRLSEASLKELMFLYINGQNL